MRWDDLIEQEWYMCIQSICLYLRSITDIHTCTDGINWRRREKRRSKRKRKNEKKNVSHKRGSNNIHTRTHVRTHARTHARTERARMRTVAENTNVKIEKANRRGLSSPKKYFFFQERILFRIDDDNDDEEEEQAPYRKRRDQPGWKLISRQGSSNSPAPSVPHPWSSQVCWFSACNLSGLSWMWSRGSWERGSCHSPDSAAHSQSHA